MLAPAFENTAVQDISHLKGPCEINILNLQRISPERDNPRFQNNLGTEVSGTKDSWIQGSSSFYEIKFNAKGQQHIWPLKPDSLPSSSFWRNQKEPSQVAGKIWRTGQYE